ncbi:MAG TPA: prepilin-type N-terminal cleavage/methylation domain-containing protein [Candidatus Paceibacterota bacterium]
MKNRGFTLIELLVVIAVIGILSSVVLASLNSARVKGRDTKRKSDLHEMRNALELYYSTNGTYPVSTNSNWHLSCEAAWNTSSNPLYTALVPTYISRLPVDPVNAPCANGPWSGPGSAASPVQQYNYAYASNGSVYDFLGALENQSDPLRCQTRDWKYHQGGELSLCRSHTYSYSLIADH